MAYKVIVKEQAKDETQVAYDHYESQLQHLGEEFLAELVKRYNDIAEHPTHYGFIDNRKILRDIRLHRFPYVVVFEIIEDSVVVYAVHCTYQHPKRKYRSFSKSYVDTPQEKETRTAESKAYPHGSRTKGRRKKGGR